MTEHPETSLTDVAVVVLVCDGHVLVRPRPATDPELAGLLEFPGGHVQPGETAARAAARELSEETGLTAPDLKRIECTVHVYPDRRLRLHFFRGELPRASSATASDAPGGTWQWRPLADLREAPVPAANRLVIEHLLREITQASPTDCSDSPQVASEPSKG